MASGTQEMKFLRAGLGWTGILEQRRNVWVNRLCFVWSSQNIPPESELAAQSGLDLPVEFHKPPVDDVVQHRKQHLRCHHVGRAEVLTLFLFLRSQKELREKQAEMVKAVTAAENAINKLQLNTVSIEVRSAARPAGTRVTQCFARRAWPVISGFQLTTLRVSDSPTVGRLTGVAGNCC